MPETAMQLPPTVRRCPQCPPYMNWREGIDWCPQHGQSIRPMLREVCACGAPIELHSVADRFCVKCGKPLENNHA